VSGILINANTPQNEKKKKKSLACISALCMLHHKKTVASAMGGIFSPSPSRALHRLFSLEIGDNTRERRLDLALFELSQVVVVW
jgi:hypothetical protein